MINETKRRIYKQHIFLQKSALKSISSHSGLFDYSWINWYKNVFDILRSADASDFLLINVFSALKSVQKL